MNNVGCKNSVMDCISGCYHAAHTVIGAKDNCALLCVGNAPTNAAFVYSQLSTCTHLYCAEG